MDTVRASAASAILLVASSRAFADAGGPGLELAVLLTIVYYVVLCIVTVPIALLLRVGNILARVLIGVAAPIVGIALAFGVCELSTWAQSTPIPFFALSLLPTVAMGILCFALRRAEIANDV